MCTECGFYTARRYASAVYAVGLAVRLSVCPSQADVVKTELNFE